LAGAWHIAQSGSILMTDLPGYGYFCDLKAGAVSKSIEDRGGKR
jgi:GTP-binding protein EngB required for normal cell division